MGYYSTIESLPKIKKEKIRSVRSAIKKFNEKANTEEMPEWQWFFENIKITSEGNIDPDGYNGKWYDTNKLALWLADKVEKGRLEYTGEDGAKWGFEFDGKGKVYFIEYTSNRGQEFKNAL